MSTAPKEALPGEAATLARALGHAHRLALLEHLAQGERAVETLARRTGVGEANLPQVARIVRSAFAERDGLEPISRAELARRLEDGLPAGRAAGPPVAGAGRA